jgi:hypothetical protein
MVTKNFLNTAHTWHILLINLENTLEPQLFHLPEHSMHIQLSIEFRASCTAVLKGIANNDCW